MPYFEGPVTSNSALLSQPTSLASNLGRTSGISSGSRSSSTNDNKIPKGAPGETLAYLIQGNQIENEKRAIKMDMIKEIEAAGGPSPNVISTIQKKYSPKLSQISKLEFQHQAMFEEVEKRGTRIDATAKALNQEADMIASDDLGNLLPIDRINEKGEVVGGYMTNSELGSQLKSSSKAPDKFVDARPIDIIKRENEIQDMLNGSANVIRLLDPASRMAILEAASRGEDITSPKYANMLSNATIGVTDNLSKLEEGVKAIQSVLTPGTEQYRALNYSFNLHDAGLNDEQKQRTDPKTGKKVETTVAERRNQYFNNFIEGKVNFKRQITPTQDNAFIDKMNLVKKAYDDRANSRLVNAIQGTGEYGFDRKVDAFYFEGTGEVKDDAYNALFGEEGAFNQYAKDAILVLNGKNVPKNADLNAEQIKELGQVSFDFRTKIGDLIKKGYQDEANRATKAYQAEYFKIVEPIKYSIFNALGKVVTDNDDLKSIYSNLKEDQYIKKLEDESFGEYVAKLPEVQLLYNIIEKNANLFANLGVISKESVDKLQEWKSVYDTTREGNIDYVQEDGEMFTANQWLARRVTSKETVLSPYESAQLMVQQRGKYEGEWGQTTGEFAGTQFEAAGMQVLKVNSIVDNYRYSNTVLNDFITNKKSNGSKFLNVQGILSESELKALIPSGDLKKFDPKVVKFIDNTPVVSKEEPFFEGLVSNAKGFFGGMDDVYEQLGVRKLSKEEKASLLKRGYVLGEGDHYIVDNIYVPYSSTMQKTDISNAKKEPETKAVPAEEGVLY